MNAFEDLKRLRERARKEMHTAMQEGETKKVVRFARILQEVDGALQAVSLAVEGIAAQLEAEGDAATADEGTRPDGSSLADLHSARARGRASREKYLGRLLARGIQLTQLNGRTFRTSSGKRVGIAYASESHANRWRMSLPDEQYDLLVLLCETSSGETLDFVLPPHYVKTVWGRLTHSTNQREWHVQRFGRNYELEPKKRLGQITIYLSRLEPLR